MTTAKKQPAKPQIDANPVSGSPRQYFWVPLAFTLGLLLLSSLGRVQSNAILALSITAASGALVLWQIWLSARRNRYVDGPAFTVVLRAQHYLQACLQLSVYAYWGWYWRPVYDHAVLLVAQLFFAYAFGILLAWSKREPYALGFGAFPIVL